MWIIGEINKKWTFVSQNIDIINSPSEVRFQFCCRWWRMFPYKPLSLTLRFKVIDPCVISDYYPYQEWISSIFVMFQMLILWNDFPCGCPSMDTETIGHRLFKNLKNREWLQMPIHDLYLIHLQLYHFILICRLSWIIWLIVSILSLLFDIEGQAFHCSSQWEI